MLRFPGWLKVYGRDEDDEAEEGRLPDLRAGRARVAVERWPSRSATPRRRCAPSSTSRSRRARYTDASLIKALEEENIGRPSTYATIVTTITKRDYVEREGRALKPTDLGMLVTKLLVDTFPDVFNVEFTAAMEEELDEVEEGKREWRTVVRDLWNPLSLRPGEGQGQDQGDQGEPAASRPTSPARRAASTSW